MSTKQEEVVVTVKSLGRDTHRRDIGYVSAIFLIVNKMIGTGIFATPANIVKLAGSPGLALILWLIGFLVALTGLYVFLEFGSMITKNGGEKNYLQYFYRKPRFLALSAYSAVVFLLGSGGNSTAFGQYICVAAGIEPGRWNMRLIGLACLTFSVLAHGVGGKYGLYIQNLLGTFKLVILLMIIIIGWVGWGGGGGIKPTHSFDHSFRGEATGYGVVTALYSVMFSYSGYTNVNYALAEVRNPYKILKFAAPAALVIVSILYILANISYLGVIPVEQIKTSGNIVAADFFGVVWGSTGRRALAVFVALSALGNVMGVTYTTARVIQELARDEVLPFSFLWGSSLPFNSPALALFEQWGISVIYLFAPPPGDAYNFIVNLGTYPGSVINAAVGIALVVIYIRKSRGHYQDWQPKIKATLPVAIFFTLANLYLISAPWIPPATKKQNVYKHLPYYLQCVVGLGLLGLGGLWWLFRFYLWPKFRNTHLEVQEYVDLNGWERSRVVSVPNDPSTFKPIEGPFKEQREEFARTAGLKAQQFSHRWDQWVNDSDPIPSGVRKLPILKRWLAPPVADSSTVASRSNSSRSNSSVVSHDSRHKGHTVVHTEHEVEFSRVV